ncbi:MAG: hypothetical protein INR71_08870, partial [Terriglobus roseus]|nr:hypothetical protein [Terriglobus roseus]
MPVWPFKRRRSGALKDKDPTTSRPLSEKPLPTAPPARGHTTSEFPPSTPKSRTVKSREAAEPAMDAQSSPRTSGGKENAPLRRGSVEDITALPGSRRLEHSPHLRPVDGNARRAEIPYNFRDNSSSHVNISRQDSVDGRSKSKLLRSKSNRQDSGAGPLRRHSSRRPRNDPLREEEIRAMSAAIPIPKRPGDGPLRRDSKKLRSLGARSSTVSLPPDGSVHSSMSNILAQRGWEVGFLDIFNPRPNVRISGVPQGVASTSVLPSPPSPIVEEPQVTEKKGKRPRTRGSARKRQTIGQEADELDAAELRLLLDRDKKRSSKKRQEQQDRLDRKLRDEAMGSPRKRDTAEVEKPPIPVRSPARSLREIRPLLDLGEPMPPTAIHPALRSQSSVGLGIDEDRSEVPSPSQQLVNPFGDPLLEEPERIDSLTAPEALTPSAFSPLATPFEEGDEPVFETARAVRLSLAHTPPLSPNVFGSLRAPSRSTAPSDLSESNSVATERRTIESH